MQIHNVNSESAGSAAEGEDGVEYIARYRNRSNSDVGEQLMGMDILENLDDSSFSRSADDMMIIVSDKNQRVVYANDSFERFTGYTKQEIIGKNCRVLQYGPEGWDTNPDALSVMREALSAEPPLPCKVTLLNYRKDGMPFLNELQIRPVQAGEGVSYYVAASFAVPVAPIDRPLELFPWLQQAQRRGTLVTEKGKRLLLVEGGGDEDAEAADGATVTSPSRANRKQDSTRVSFVAETNLPTDKGVFRMRAYKNHQDGSEPVAMVVGDVTGKEDVVIRVHDQCQTSEVFGSLKCDCRQQLDYAMEHIRDNGSGIVFYMPQEGRGIGLANKVKAYQLQEHGFDTVDANRALGFEDDLREYGSVPRMLEEMQVRSVRLLTNNPLKLEILTALGVKISGRVPIVLTANPHSEHYLHSKSKRMGHLLS